MKSVSPKFVIALVSAVAPMTVLILTLSAPWSDTHGRAHGQAAGQVLMSPCRVAGRGFKMESKPRPLDHVFIHDMMTTAISIADRL
jgi:hypothetical protein